MYDLPPINYLEGQEKLALTRGSTQIFENVEMKNFLFILPTASSQIPQERMGDSIKSLPQSAISSGTLPKASLMAV